MLKATSIVPAAISKAPGTNIGRCIFLASSRKIMLKKLTMSGLAEVMTRTTEANPKGWSRARLRLMNPKLNKMAATIAVQRTCGAGILPENIADSPLTQKTAIRTVVELAMKTKSRVLMPAKWAAFMNGPPKP